MTTARPFDRRRIEGEQDNEGHLKGSMMMKAATMPEQPNEPIEQWHPYRQPLPPRTLGGQHCHPPYQPRRELPTGVLWGIAYLCGILAAAITGSAFVLGGLLAGASGWNAVALAASVPAAGVLWVITITVLWRLFGRYQQS